MIKRSHRHQHGVALVTAMLIVAIVATIAAYVAISQQTWLRQTENIADRAQAEALRQGALRFASVMLSQDAKDSPDTDDLTEKWAKPLPPLPVEGGTILVGIGDAQAQFNLNMLVRAGEPSTKDIGVFKRLLLSQGLDAGLSDALVDWIDANSVAQPNGAEDNDYLNLNPPYRTANQPLKSVDELRLVKGFNDKVIETLRPYVTVLPEASDINVNTTSSVVLAALFNNLTPALAEQVIAAREKKPWTSAEQFLAQLPPGTEPPQAAYVFKSGYFMVTVDARIGRTQRRTEALISRPVGGKATTVLWHRPQNLQIKKDEATA